MHFHALALDETHVLCLNQNETMNIVEGILTNTNILKKIEKYFQKLKINTIFSEFYNLNQYQHEFSVTWRNQKSVALNFHCYTFFFLLYFYFYFFSSFEPNIFQFWADFMLFSRH